MNQDQNPETEIVSRLSQVLKERKNASADSSYVAQLYAQGLNKILEKVGEEATEVVLASRDLAQGAPEAAATKNASSEDAEEALVSEVADLWFHTMVLLTHQDVAPARVLNELASRFGVSGIEEKNSRS